MLSGKQRRGGLLGEIFNRVLWKHPKSRSLGKQKPVTKGSQFKFMAPSIELCCEDLGSYWKMKMESPQSIF